MGWYLEQARRLREERPSGGYEKDESTKEAPNDRASEESMRWQVHEVVLASRKVWSSACLELAQALDWPKVRIRPHMTVGGGEYAWLLFLANAPIVQLRDWTFPVLRAEMAKIGPPAGEGSNHASP